MDSVEALCRTMLLMLFTLSFKSHPMNGKQKSMWQLKTKINEKEVKRSWETHHIKMSGKKVQPFPHWILWNYIWKGAELFHFIQTMNMIACVSIRAMKNRSFNLFIVFSSIFRFHTCNMTTLKLFIVITLE